MGTAAGRRLRFAPSPAAKCTPRSRDAFARYDVQELGADPPGWWAELDAWADEYGAERVVAYLTNRPSTMAPPPSSGSAPASSTGHSTTTATPLLAEHVGNAVTRETTSGTVIRKGSP